MPAWNRNHGAITSPLLAMLLTAIYLPGASAQPATAPIDAVPGTYIDASTLARKLREQAERHADPALAPIGVNGEYSIQEVHRNKPGPPAVHAGWTELHYILDGSAEFVTGGVIKGDTDRVIVGGEAHTVRKGDAIIVPADTPHWYRKIDGSLTVLEVRFPSPQAMAPH